MIKSILFSILLATALSVSASELPSQSSSSVLGSDQALKARVTPEWLTGEWRLVSQQDGKSKTLFKDSRPVVMTLSISTINVTGGCNNKSGQFRFENSRLVTESLRSTLMACQPERLMEIDDIMGRVLGSGPVAKRQGKHLTLTAKTGEELRFVK